MKPLYAVLIFCVCAFGKDTLSIANTKGPGGSTVNLIITLNTSTTKLTGLQWDLSLPSGALFGLSASIPGKTLTCNMGRCLIVGKQVPISSGPVAVLAVNVPSNAAASLSVTLGNVVGVMVDGSRREIAGTTAAIVIGPPKPCDCTGSASAVRSSFTLLDFSVPDKPDAGKDKLVELGVRFQSKVAGEITAIRFYKSASNSGTHIGTVWSPDGTKLASVKFISETALGWQTAKLSPPLKISPGTIYTVSYWCPEGHYASEDGFFSKALENGPLHVPANGGVFGYGNDPTFPGSTYQSSNYWVDFSFTPSK